jgi:hypothetical protein
MSDVRIIVRFEREEPGFTAGHLYEVLLVQDHKFLLVNDDARFAWVGADQPTPEVITRGTDRIFDLAVHRARRNLEGLAGKPVVLTTWENLGFDPDEVTDESMLVYRGVVERYDGETLFLRRYDAEGSRFGVLPKAIATIVEETGSEG